MAATRKLQGEIDRCLKKVTEGVETFEDIWQKVHNATNSNQKEKYEADLKKEIKKLQRLRDQIKSWIASGEIKDKSTLMDNRKLIETQMERFKVVERETKTKAYSKEGLGAAQKLDPAQKEREEIQHWLVSSIDLLNLQTDSFESEIESLLANKKKKLDKDKQERMDELKSRLERHRFHIRKLETLLRMLDNMSVEVQQIRRIKDNVEYYIESSQEPDFEDSEFIYDDIIGLDDVELSGVGLPSSATTDSNDTGGTPTSIISGSSPISSSPLANSASANATTNNQNYNHSSDSSNEAEKRVVCKDQPKPIKPTPVRATSSLNNSSGSVLNYSCNSTSSTPGSKQQQQQQTIPPQQPALASSTPSKPTQAAPVQQQPQTPAPTTNSTPAQPGREPSPAAQMLGGNFAAVAATTVTSKNNSSKWGIASGETNPTSVITNLSQVPVQNTTNPINSSIHMNSSSVASTQPTQNSTNSLQKSFTESHVQNNCLSPDLNNSNETSPLNVETSQPITNGNVGEKISEGMTSLKSMAQQVIDRAGLDNNQVILEPNNKAQNQGKSDAHIPPLLGVAPLGAVPLQKEHQTQFQLMEAAFYHMPHPSDSERIRTYLPRNPYNTPAYYVQSPLAHSDTLEFYQRLATETLFFVFYYMEGTKAQYLAAKALKKQSWRFHTKYMMWFQRHEEPKIINEEYEQGTYIYFDYEKWGQRKKEGFTFEYKYLEDRDLN
ncbi:CCR4-NOT transcription complex subunit 3 isoform X2 [Aethina tumida]|uniref:CCR4-NOT transcription complex subunit 3 isoform X2 n=1 Tax=Aethina tumida TaxID=116153 RepID=UPI00096B1210|nr:CCR4-NOT transcription complex subunit 3 isoform X2 [Aethina tumida]